MIIINEFGESFQNLLEQKLDWPDFLSQGRQMVGELASNQGWLNNILALLVLDDSFYQSQYQSADPNDIILYRSPSRLFSVRAFIWQPGAMNYVHDHGAWGIVGACFNQTKEKKFRRLDDGSREGFAELEVVSEAILSPGETTYVLPLNDGIHQMAAMHDLASISIHVYGSPVRKNYFQIFDMHFKTVRRAYPPAIQKKVLAIQALGCMPETWAEEVLKEAISRNAPEYVTFEGKKALNNIKRIKDLT